jgi:chromosome segregation ATPase
LSASSGTLSKKEQEEVNQYNDFKTLMGKPESALTPDEKARLERLKGKFGDSLSPLGSLISALRGLVSDNTTAISSNDAEVASWERYDHDLDDYGDRLETVEAQLDQEIEDAVTRYEEINSDVIDQGLEIYTYEDIPDELTPEEQAERDAENRTRNNAQESVFGSRPGGRPVDRSGGRGR